MVYGDLCDLAHITSLTMALPTVSFHLNSVGFIAILSTEHASPLFGIFYLNFPLPEMFFPPKSKWSQEADEHTIKDLKFAFLLKC